MGPRVCPLGQFFWDEDNLFLTMKELHCTVLDQCLFAVGLGASAQIGETNPALTSPEPVSSLGTKDSGPVCRQGPDSGLQGLHILPLGTG